MSTAAKGARGGAVTIAGQLVKVLITFLSVVILSRLLSPDDFGLIAMVLVFVALGDVLRDFGMPTAAVQAKELTQAQASNLFWVNTLLGVAVAGAMTAATPLIVLFYSDERLAAVVPLTAISLVLSSLGVQFQVQLVREMRFTASAVTAVASQAAGIVVAITSAMAGAGYWALVWQTLATAIALLVLRVIASQWLPSWPRSGSGTRKLIGSGANFGFAYLLNYLANNVDTISIGARFDPTSVGIYNRAFQLLTAPVRTIIGPLTNVIVPTINRMRAEGADVDRSLIKVQSALGTVLVLIFAVTASSAEYFVPLLLGVQWQPSVPIFQILAAGGIFWTFSNISYWGFIVHDRSRQLLYYSLVTKSVSIMLVVAGSFISLEATAAGYALGLAISWPINLIWLAKTAGQKSSGYLRNGLRISVAAVGAFAASRLLVDVVPSLGLLGATVVTGASAALVFLALIVLVPGGLRDFRSGIAFARGVLGAK